MRAAISACLLLVGCGDTAALPTADAALADARDASGNDATLYPGGCHRDCFQGSTTCERGVVTVRTGGVLPCGAPDCPVVSTVTCARGCRADMKFQPSDELAPHTFCEEYRPRSVGDPCTSSLDCTPVPATKTDAGVTNVYLKCDLVASTCVEGDEPVIPGYLAHCGFGALKLADGEVRVLEAPSCSGKLCLARGYAGCVAQACTLACIGDDECPRGSLCAPTQEPPDKPNGVCVPFSFAETVRCVPPADAGADG